MGTFKVLNSTRKLLFFNDWGAPQHYYKMWNTSNKTGSLYALPCKIRSSKINIGQRKKMKTKQENWPNETTTTNKNKTHSPYPISKHQISEVLWNTVSLNWKKTPMHTSFLHSYIINLGMYHLQIFKYIRRKLNTTIQYCLTIMLYASLHPVVMTAVHLNSVPPEQTPILLHRLDIETLPRRIFHTPDFVAASLNNNTDCSQSCT